MKRAPAPSGKTDPPNEIVELDSRGSDGLDIRLLWCPRTNELSVEVTDQRRHESFVVPVPPGTNPQDVFQHPYAHASSTGPTTPTGR
jgi:hypothetical protein